MRQSSETKNILVFQTAFLGDVVLSTPIFKNIRARYINASITALVIPSNEQVLSGNPYIDSIICYDKKAPNKIANFVETLNEIKARKFDIVFSLHRSFRTALMLRLAKIPTRIGFADSACSFFYTKVITRNMSQHDVQRNLSILTGAGIKPADMTDELLITYSAEDKASLGKSLRDKKIYSTKQKIVVSPGSVWATKRYPHESYAKVINMLLDDGKYDVILTGTKADSAVADEIMSLTKNRATNLTAKTTLKELAALLDQAALMITNDSGPLHIAAAFNTPLIAIFGATTQALGFYPYNKNSVVIEKDLPCRPCGKHGPMKCPIKTFDCMKLIEPKEIYNAAMKLLK